MRIGARSSPLSRAQVEEVRRLAGLDFEVIWVTTMGDRDKTTSLRTLDKTDFFTRELDQMLLRGEISAAVHSAKDLPDPIPDGLALAALTRGEDPRDSLVFRGQLPSCAVIATSSERREAAVRQIVPGCRCVDVRGTIEERLAKIDRGEVAGVIVAEAALIRLTLTYLNRVFLPGPTAPLQGRLAVVCRSEDAKILSLFAKVHDDTLPRP